jgi:hypothetical protein
MGNNLNGSTPGANQALGSGLPENNNGTNPPVDVFKFFPTNLQDFQQFFATYQDPTGGQGSGAPGLMLDTRPTGQPPYGQTATSPVTPASAPINPSGPGIHLITGANGQPASCIRIAASDAKGVSMWIQEFQVCVNGQQMYAKFLMSAPYATSSA